MLNVISKSNIYILLFVAIGLAYVIFLIYHNVYKNDGKEHFEEPVEDTQYKANMHVIKVFDVVLNRKPTTDELSKYSKITNEQDILIAVMNDYKDTEGAKKTNVDKVQKLDTEKEGKDVKEDNKRKESYDDEKQEPESFGAIFKETYESMNDSKVCLNKAEVLSMLTNLNEQVNSFIAKVK